MADSDEELVAVPKRQKVVHHGTLVDHMKQHGREEKSQLKAGINAGNINISDGKSYFRVARACLV